MPFYYGHITLLKALYAFQGAPLWSCVAGTNTVTMSANLKFWFKFGTCCLCLLLRPILPHEKKRGTHEMCTVYESQGTWAIVCTAMHFRYITE